MDIMEMYGCEDMVTNAIVLLFVCACVRFYGLNSMTNRMLINHTVTHTQSPTKFAVSFIIHFIFFHITYYLLLSYVCELSLIGG